jgi:hypothetical protein
MHQWVDMARYKWPLLLLLLYNVIDFEFIDNWVIEQAKE